MDKYLAMKPKKGLALPQELRDHIRDRFVAGESLESIAKWYGANRNHISKMLLEYGGVFALRAEQSDNKMERGTYFRIPKEKLEELRRRLKQGDHVKDIAEWYGCSQHYIRQLAIEYFGGIRRVRQGKEVFKEGYNDE